MESTYRPQPVPVAVNDPLLRISPVDRCARISFSIPPMFRERVRLTGARALSEVGGVDDHVGGVGELPVVSKPELE